MEFSFDYGILLIHLLCLLLFINSYTSLLVVPSHASTNFLIKRKEKEKKINNNLAVFGCVMIVQLVAYSTLSLVKCFLGICIFFLFNYNLHFGFSCPQAIGPIQAISLI